MSGSIKGARRPVVFWAICPECLTYIWIDESSLAGEEATICPYCEKRMSLQGGADLAASCRQLQALIEDIERRIAEMPAAVDVHRFFFEQIGYIAAAFNERLDSIQADKDLKELREADVQARKTR